MSTKELSHQVITARGIIKKGSAQPEAPSYGDMKKNAEKALIKLSLRIAAIDNKLSEETDERKDLQFKIKATTIGKRLKQIGDNRKDMLSEKSELNSALKHLLKFFQDEKIQIDISKIKQIEKL